MSHIDHDTTPRSNPVIRTGPLPTTMITLTGDANRMVGNARRELLVALSKPEIDRAVVERAMRTLDVAICSLEGLLAEVSKAVR